MNLGTEVLYERDNTHHILVLQNVRKPNSLWLMFHTTTVDNRNFERIDNAFMNRFTL